MIGRNWLLTKLRDGSSPCIGTWITLPSMDTVDVICAARPDFIVIDCEHAPISLETAQKLAMVADSREVSTVIRIPEVSESAVLRSLDTGAHGIQVPNVGSRDIMDRVYKYRQFSPVGSRGFSPYTRSCGFSTLNSDPFVKNGAENLVTVCQVEGKAGIENIEAILSDAPFDVCFLGLYDLSAYIGRPGELAHPELRSLFESLVDKITAASVIPGSISNTVDQQKFLIDSGVRYITHSADCHILNEAYRSAFARSR